MRSRRQQVLSCAMDWPKANNALIIATVAAIICLIVLAAFAH